MYKSYLESYLGLLEIGCDENYLKYITIVEKINDGVENEVSREVKKQLEQYFKYERFEFDVPINFSDSFKDRVYKDLYETGYGEILTYKVLANNLNSRAYQAVGSAMANNPYFIVVP